MVCNKKQSSTLWEKLVATLAGVDCRVGFDKLSLLAMTSGALGGLVGMSLSDTVSANRHAGAPGSVTAGAVSMSNGR